MSDKTDPRRCVECGLVRGTDSEPQVHRYETDSRSDVLDRALYMAETAQAVDEADVLAAFDAADRAAGIVRVDTRDEALVERLATVLCDTVCSCTKRDDSFFGLCCACDARAVLAALREES